MRGKTLQTIPFKDISTVLWVHQKLPQSTVSQALPSNKSYESKAGCNRTPATVLWVPLIKGPQQNCEHSPKITNKLSSEQKKKVSNGPQKVTDPIFVNPPPEGLLNNANSNVPSNFSGGKGLSLVWSLCTFWEALRQSSYPAEVRK